MAAQQHDLIIIGAGPGGYTAAIRAAQLGLNVACIEEEPALGGTCLRIGCIPSKALLESSELFAQAGHTFAAHGIKCNQPELDLQTMLQRKDRIVTTLTKGVEHLFKKNEITRHLGTARLEGLGKVSVTAATELSLASKARLALMSCTTPTTSPCGFRMGTARMDFVR